MTTLLAHMCGYDPERSGMLVQCTLCLSTFNKRQRELVHRNHDGTPEYIKFPCKECGVFLSLGGVEIAQLNLRTIRKANKILRERIKGGEE